MSFKNYLLAMPYAFVDTSTFVGFTFINYYGAGGIPNNCVILRFTNNSNIDVEISYDGGDTVHDILLHGTSMQILAQTNHTPSSEAAFFRKGMKISLRAALGAAGVGRVIISGFYVPQGD